MACEVSLDEIPEPNGFDNVFKHLQDVVHQLRQQHAMEVAELKLDNKRLRGETRPQFDADFPAREEVAFNGGTEPIDQLDTETSLDLYSNSIGDHDVTDVESADGEYPDERRSTDVGCLPEDHLPDDCAHAIQRVVGDRQSPRRRVSSTTESSSPRQRISYQLDPTAIEIEVYNTHASDSMDHGVGPLRSIEFRTSSIESPNEELDMKKMSLSRTTSSRSSRSKAILRKPWNDLSSQVRKFLSERSRCSELSRPSVAKTESTATWGMASTWGVASSNPYAGRCPILNPVSKVRLTWLICGFTLWIYDLVMLPIAFCFSVDARTANAMRVVQVLSLIFWTVDIPVTFATGIWDPVSFEIDSNPLHIFRTYVRSWFILDLYLVVQEFVVLTISDASSWIVRMLQLTLLIRWFKLTAIATQFHLLGSLSSFLTSSSKMVLKMSAWYSVGIHLVTCFWYGLGSVISDGWVSESLKSEAMHTKYVVSLRWTCSRLHGLGNEIPPSTELEITLDSILILFSLFACVVYMGRVTAMLVKQMPSHDKNLKMLGRQFAHRHKISFSLSQRMRRYLEISKHADGVLLLSANENLLLRELPPGLRNDLICESRWPIMKNKQLFRDMFEFNARVIHHLCTAAISDLSAYRDEVLFSRGDVCSRMLFLRSGRLVYDSEKKTSHLSRRSSDGYLREGTSISEAVLWTLWEHCGALISTNGSLLLSVDPSSFADVVVQYDALVSRVVRYAKCFVRNMVDFGCSDVTEFDNMSFTDLEVADECLEGGSHYLFISHYKVEAGTEATLMRESFEKIFDAEPSHPANEMQNQVFVDSENLDDLAELMDHVANSKVVILLLTPGVLSRPWCLIELVTAIRFGVSVLPVEIQRPGVRYQYPDDDFYLKLKSGRILNDDDLVQLQSQGVDLDEVDSAIRRVFQIIAMPFSPHKTKSVRDAELKDILKRVANRESRLTASASISRLSSFG